MNEILFNVFRNWRENTMKTEYEEIKLESGESATSFTIITRKGDASGVFTDRIYVHHIAGEGCVKGIMDILINKFKTNKITFTPLINDNIKNSVRGNLKVMEVDNPENPYGESFEYLEVEWQTT